jgi:hypothetical protein
MCGYLRGESLIPVACEGEVVMASGTDNTEHTPDTEPLDNAAPAAKTELMIQSKIDLRLRLIRAALLLMVFFATAVALTSWRLMDGIRYRYRLIPLVLFPVACLIASEVYRKARELANIRSAYSSPRA